MRAVFVVLLVSCATACSAAQRGNGPGAKAPGSEQDEIEVPRTVITPQASADIPQLLQEAAALAKAERWAAAALAYDRIYRLEPERQYGDQAVWGAADAYDHALDLPAALARFELFVQRQPDTALGTAALVRASRIYVYSGRFQPAGLFADRLLKRLDDLTDAAKISVYSAKALSLIERTEYDQASNFIEKGRSVIDSSGLDRATPIDRDLAQLYYALGELRRSRAALIRFEPIGPDFVTLLEQRCQLLLDAQSAYSDATRARDRHWSTMAGFRIAELYQSLHQDLLAVQPPPSADTERKRQLFEGAVRTRFAILLTKAKGMAEFTLSMAERTGERSEWVDRTRAALTSIDQGIKDEEAALAKLPYTKQDFEAYFASKEAQASTPPKPKKP